MKPKLGLSGKARDVVLAAWARPPHGQPAEGIDELAERIRLPGGTAPKLACESGDSGTADFLTGLVEDHEKTAWMLRAHLA